MTCDFSPSFNLSIIVCKMSVTVYGVPITITRRIR